MKLGFVVKDLSFSQLSYCLIKNLNLLAHETDADPIIFTEQSAPFPITPSFAVMNVVELYGFDGVAIATDLSTAEKLIRMPGPSKKYLYVWDLEWSPPRQPKDFSTLCHIYRNKDVSLLSRGREHRKAIEDSWNRSDVGIVEDCNFRHLVEVLNG